MFYDIFKQLCDSKGISPSRACLDMKLSRSLGAKWKNTGANPSFDVLTRMSDYFGVSTDYLLGNEQKETPALTEKDERDISKKLQQTLDELENSQNGLMFDGQPLDDETKELLAISLRNSLELSKKIAKQKYTPKKYRKQNKSEGD